MGKTLLLILAWALAVNSAVHGADNGAASVRTKPPIKLSSQGRTL